MELQELSTFFYSRKVKRMNVLRNHITSLQNMTKTIDMRLYCIQQNLEATEVNVMYNMDKEKLAILYVYYLVIIPGNMSYFHKF